MVTFYSILYKSKNIIVSEIDYKDEEMLNKFPSYEEYTEANYK